MSQASVSSLLVPGTHSACLLRSCPARVQAMLASTSVFDSNHAASRRVGTRKALLSNTPQIYFLARRLSEVVRIGGSLLRKALTSCSAGVGTHGPCLVRTIPGKVQAMLPSIPVFDSNDAGSHRSGGRNPLLSNTSQIYFLARRLSEVVRIGGSLLRKALASSGRETHGPCLVRPYPARVQAMPASISVFGSNHAAFRRSGGRNPLLSNTPRQKQLSTPDPWASLSVHLRPSAARISWSIPIPFPWHSYD